MDILGRILFIAVIGGFAVFRLVRYFHHGVSKRVTVIAPAAGMFMPQLDARATDANNPPPTSPPAGRWSLRLLRFLIWAGANGILLAVLFAWPAAEGIPVVWRLFAMIFVNFYLVPFAGQVGELANRRAAKE